MSSDKYYEIYNSIQNLDSKIRFVTIVDNQGHLMFGGQKEGITNHLKPEYQKESLRHVMDAWRLRNKFSDYIGKGKYAIVEYEKIKRISMPLNDDKLIYLTTETDIDHDALIRDIKKIIE